MNLFRRRYLPVVLAAFACCWIVVGQSRINNWPTHGGDPQRSQFIANESGVNKANVKDLQLLWKVKLETLPNSLRPLMAPLIQGRLVSYRGYKELAYVATNADIVYAIDADAGKVFWQRHLEYSVREPQATVSTWTCPGGLTATPTMPMTTRGGLAPAAARGNPFVNGQPSVYAISSDGRLHRLNTSTGDDMAQPVSVIPANARATNLVMVDNVIYTTTTNECHGARNAVWAIDLTGDTPKTRSYLVGREAGFSLGQPFVGGNGTVYVEATTEPAFHPRRHSTHGIMTFGPRDLEVQKSVSLVVASGQESNPDRGVAGADLSIGLVNHGNRPFVVTPDERTSTWLYVWDLEALYPESPTPPLVQSGPRTTGLRDRGITGNLATWQDTDGTRWVLAPVEGPMNPELKPLMTNGSAVSGFIAAFKVEDRGGKPALTPVWVSRDIVSPQTPVVANGIVFVLSSGEFTRQSAGSGAVEERPKNGTHATLYALDGRTGRELYSSKNLVTVPAALTGLTVANGRVFFGGLDGALYAFGLYMER